MAYYQEAIETASREQIRQWQDERLVKQVRHVWESVPYYRRKMEEKGLTPEDIRSVDDLHKLGYKVAVDDFGSGSSSLSLLREVTFDTLKIDKGFVDRAYAKDLTILSYMIKLAKALGVETLAEGVEQKEQVDTLLSLGCEVIQGYYFDRPLPKENFETRIIDRRYRIG